MAAEIIGGSFLSSLFQMLFDNLNFPDFRNFFRENELSEGPLEELQTKLEFANQLYHAAEEKQFGKKEVREWLFKLRDVICTAEELLDKTNYATLQYKNEAELRVASSIAKRIKREFTSSSKSLDDDVREILKKLGDIMRWQDFYGIKVDADKKTLPRLPAPFAVESKVFGRTDAKETIISRLLSDNSNGDEITVIPIVGMGGVGKTTLAQLVCDDDRVKNHFARAWVTVSDDFDILKIMRTIFKDITGKECDSDNRLPCKLREELKMKKSIIVLDDIWNEKYELWDSLKSRLQYGACGSKIIVTTRSERVARVMKNVEPYDLKELSNDDCWSLFKEHAFGNANSDSSQDLLKIGKKIVKKCKGLPLAVKVLAGLLHSMKDREEWLKILMNDLWQLQLQEKMSNDILPSLWFSYNYLPLHLKRCFAYLSIFPKGFQIWESQKTEIVLLWMAEGLLQPDLRGRKAIQAGYECFEDLISMLLLQRSSMHSTIIVMHDCMHDLATFLAGEFGFSLNDNNKAKLTGRTRHFSYSRAKDFQNLGDLSMAKRLRTCLQIPSTMNYMWLQHKKPIIPVGEFLRSLCLAGAHFPVVPDSVCNLKLLRYLDLSRNDFVQIPNKLCSLSYMQTLRLSYCEKLTELPTDMGKLVNLCCLDIEGVPLHKMPPQIGKLKDLVTLSQFVLGKNDCSSIKELGELCDLSGKLAIKNLQNVDDVEDVKVAKLQAKKYLDKIEYHWSSGDETGHSQKDRLVLDALPPHANVKDIVISGYSGETFSEWVVNNSYASIATVSISNCKSCFLPPLGQLRCLENLSIAQCNNVTEIGHEFYQESHSRIEPFRSLKVLKFKDMLKWTAWSFLEGGCFFRLEKLSIQRCPNLKISFPYCFPSLKTLFIGAMEPNFLFLPENRKIVEGFPSLKIMSVENCPGILESSPFWKSFPNITYLLFAPTYRRENTIVWNAYSPSKLFIENCENMVSLPKAHIPTVTSIRIYRLDTLVYEDFQHFTSLKRLELEDCKKLWRFPGEMLPTSLTSLSIKRLPSLKDVGNGFQHLTSLEYLTVEDCKDLQCLIGEMLPKSLTSLSIKRLPSLKDVGNGFQHLTSLEYFRIEGCRDLQCLTGVMLPTSLTLLSNRGLPNLKDLDKSFQHLTSLKDLYLNDLECFNVEMLPKSLTSLSIRNLQNLEESVMGIRHLTSLEKLSLSHFGFEKISRPICLQQWLPTSLTSLSIFGLHSLIYLCKSARDLISLEELEISFCENLECLASEDGKGFQDLTSLKRLSIQCCKKLELLLERDLPTTLTSLFIVCFENLKDLNQVGIQHLVSLERLDIDFCKNLRSFPEEGLPKCLSTLRIVGCPLLIPRCERDVGQDWHKIAHIPSVIIKDENYNVVVSYDSN